ncbi:hypothetical protein ACVWZ4_007366 [Bradyrhizobium sp. USDA 4472]
MQAAADYDGEAASGALSLEEEGDKGPRLAGSKWFVYRNGQSLSLVSHPTARH